MKKEKSTGGQHASAKPFSVPVEVKGVLKKYMTEKAQEPLAPR